MRNDVIRKPTLLAELLLRQYVREGDVVVDATAGNGHDTVLLCELVGKEGQVYAFDIQEEALAQTRDRLLKQGELGDDSGVVRLIHDSHHLLADYVREPVQAVVFNLGYLPGGDKSVTTEPTKTLAALESALRILAPGGVLVVTMYSGHDEGREKQAVLAYCRNLDAQAYHCIYVSLVNQKGYPPEVAAVVKK